MAEPDDFKDVKDLSVATDVATDTSDSETGSIRAADAQLEALGHKAELKRVHSFWTSKYMPQFLMDRIDETASK